MLSISRAIVITAVITINLTLSACSNVSADVLEERVVVSDENIEAHDYEENNFECVRRIFLKGVDDTGKAKRSAEMGAAFDDLVTTLEYGEGESETRQPPAMGGGSEGSVYDIPPSETPKVLGSDRKETGVTLTDKAGIVYDTGIDQSLNKVVAFNEDVKTKILPSQTCTNVDPTSEIPFTDNSNHHDMKIEHMFKPEGPVGFSSQQAKEEGKFSNDVLIKSAYEIFSNPDDENQDTSGHEEKFTEEEPFNDISIEQTEWPDMDVTVPTENIKTFTEQGFQVTNSTVSNLIKSEARVNLSTQNPLSVGTKNIFIKKDNNFSVRELENEPLTTDTTISTTSEIQHTSVYEVYGDKNTSHLTVENQTTKPTANSETVLDLSSNLSGDALLPITEIRSEKEDFEYFVNSTVNSSFKTPVGEVPPSAERLYSSHMERYEVGQSIPDMVDKTEGNEDGEKMITSEIQAHRDYEDKSEEDSVVIKSLLDDYPSFKKEKIEPGTLIEECADCDIRILPIRPSQQRSTPEFETEAPPKARIKFSELPEGTELQITKLGLSDGIFLFSYLSQFLSWIQPNEFPVDLLRDALRNQITWISLITQSLQVEAGFVACLVVGVLLALAVPVVVLSHACYRMGGRKEDSEETTGWAGNCKRRTLVFILQLLLILLFAGMVAMFVTNEQLSSAVVQSPDVLQTSLSDVSAFVHNSHLQLHFLVTQSTDQALQAINADLDNVDSLLGRPIQREMVRETGLDVAVETLSDLTRETHSITQQVDRFQDEVRVAQEMLMSSREKLSDLRQQVEVFRRACGTRDRMLCDSIDASGLDIVLRLDKIKMDDRLNRMRRMGGVGLEIAMAEAKDHFMAVPSRVDADTRDAREGVRRLLSRQREEIDDKSEELKKFAREVTNKVNEAKYQAGFWMQDLDQFEYWRWIVCLGGGAAVLMIWTMLLFSMCCGCCGSERAAGPTILGTIVLVCLFSTALWLVVMMGLLVGGHGEVFVCRPLYDEPDYPVISNLVDQPGVFYDQQRGGFIANVIYGNDTLDVPIREVLQECQKNRPIYSTLGLQRVFDVEHAVDQHQWDSVSAQMRAVRANLSSLEVLSPILQRQLTDLLNTLSVNFTEHRIQMSKPVTGKDMDSFARQLDNIGNQMRDLATASRMETLSSRTRRIIDSHIRPLEVKKDALVYQLTALEVQTGPLQKQVNQSLSHLKTIQFFINNQGEAIANAKSREYVERMLSYLNQLRHHVVETVKNSVAPCRPLWEIFNSTRLFLCRHTMDPLNGYWFATMWCLLILLIATPVCLKLVDYYRAQGSAASGSPESLIPETSASWSSPGYELKGQNGYIK